MCREWLVLWGPERYWCTQDRSCKRILSQRRNLRTRTLPQRAGDEPTKIGLRLCPHYDEYARTVTSDQSDNRRRRQGHVFCSLKPRSRRCIRGRFSSGVMTRHASREQPKVKIGVRVRGREHFAVRIHLPLSRLTLLLSRL